MVVRIADRPPDENHPYGHARAENLGAMGEALLLVITAGWVLREAYARLFVHAEHPETSVWAFLVLGGSLLIDWQRSRALARAAAQFKSQALAADAAHFATDMISSVVVLISLITLAVAEPLKLLPEWLLLRIDAFAAVVVACITLWVAVGMGRRAIRSLMDDVPADLGPRLVSQVAALPSVVPNSVQMRTRFVGEQPYVEVTLGTSRAASLVEAHKLTEEVEAVIRSELDGAEVLVHVEPARTAAEPYTTAVYAAAHQLGLDVHNLDVYQLNDAVRVDVDLEVPSSLSFGEAHTLSERLERAICTELGSITAVSVHLEPRRDQVQPAVHYVPLSDEIQRVVTLLPEASAITQIETILTSEGAIVTLRHAFPRETPLRTVHDAMAQLERELRHSVPNIVRVQIDPEPT